MVQGRAGTITRVTGLVVPRETVALVSILYLQTLMLRSDSWQSGYMVMDTALAFSAQEGCAFLHFSLTDIFCVYRQTDLPVCQFVDLSKTLK